MNAGMKCPLRWAYVERHGLHMNQYRLYWLENAGSSYVLRRIVTLMPADIVRTTAPTVPLTNPLADDDEQALMQLDSLMLAAIERHYAIGYVKTYHCIDAALKSIEEAKDAAEEKERVATAAPYKPSISQLIAKRYVARKDKVA